MAFPAPIPTFCFLAHVPLEWSSPAETFSEAKFHQSLLPFIQGHRPMFFFFSVPFKEEMPWSLPGRDTSVRL